MRISSIPQIYRHLNRWREILSVLSKYELAGWIGRLGPEFAKDLLKTSGGTAIARHPWKSRVRLALAELGPTFVKLGQLLSTRPDLVGVEMAEELTQLQDNVPADPPDKVRAAVEAELGHPIAELFAEFDDQPLASASVGQVHAARLADGRRVVVKVQHPDIQKKVAADLEILAGLAQLAERIPEFRNFRPRATVDEFRRTMHRELDFGREVRNIQQFARDFAGNPTVRIPLVYPQLSSSRVVTMEFIDGVKLSDAQGLRSAGFDLPELARRGAKLYLEMIFKRGFYHADPHPGNVFILDGNVIALLDYGMVGRIDEQLLEDIADMLVAVAELDAELLTSIIMRVGSVPPEMDRAALSLDVADFVAFYSGQPLDQFDVSSALTEATEVMWRYGIMLPARLAMLIKVLATLEGTARLLSPRFNLMEVMTPYRKEILKRRLSPRRQWRRIRRLISETQHLIEILPRGLIDILQQVQTGQFDVHLDHRGLEPSVNRLVLGMLASAIFVGSSLLLSLGAPPVIREVSVSGTFGILLSMGMALRLWRAINKSGHLDRRK